MYIRHETITSLQTPPVTFADSLDDVDHAEYVQHLNTLFVARAMVYSFDIDGDTLSSTSMWTNKELYEQSVNDLNAVLSGYLSSNPDAYYSNTEMFTRVVTEEFTD